MDLSGWICSGLAALAVGFLIYFIIRNWLDENLVEREGREVVAWIVFANEKLYQASDQADYSYAQVVFNLAPDTPENRATLERIAVELREFKPDPGATGDERMLGSILRSHVPGPPVRVPTRIAGQEETYSASPHVYWSKLPERRLTRPYIYCKVVVGQRRVVQHAPYPS